MEENEVEVLARAHRLFTGARRSASVPPPEVTQGLPLDRFTDQDAGDSHRRYQVALRRLHSDAASAADTDGAVTEVLRGAYHDHAHARLVTRQVLDEARADTAAGDNPMAQREAIRRRIARLRAQRAHLVAARGRSRQHAAVLRSLRYRTGRRRTRLGGVRLPPPHSRAGIAVRAALSRLGRPYVWGATGPDQFDCSGLVKWSYAQAGVHLDRTTYQQIHDGIPVPRAQVRPGDLVFPHPGHVQLAIGNNLVVEAPYSGATVRISPLGANVAIRRPVG